MALEYVKFQRGSQAAYNKIKREGRLESNALYFIYDNEAPEAGGLLYLGEILIGGSGLAGATQLSQLTDVTLSEEMIDGMILQYNALAKTWETRSIANAIANHTSIVDNTIKQNGESDIQALERIDPNPKEGDIIFIDGVPYIYNGDNWQQLIGSNIEQRISTLESKVTTLTNGLEAIDAKIINAINSANHLKYETRSELPEIPEGEDTSSLENIVFLISNENTTGNNLYDEYMFINGQYEKIGQWKDVPDLSNYVTTTQLESTVGTLNTTISNLQSQLGNYVPITTYNAEVGSLETLRTTLNKPNATIVSSIIDLDGRLQWHQLDNE